VRLFTVETASLRRYYVIFFIELQSHRTHPAGCSAHPSGRWDAQQARNLSLSSALVASCMSTTGPRRDGSGSWQRSRSRSLPSPVPERLYDPPVGGGDHTCDLLRARAAAPCGRPPGRASNAVESTRSLNTIATPARGTCSRIRSMGGHPSTNVRWADVRPRVTLCPHTDASAASRAYGELGATLSLGTTSGTHQRSPTPLKLLPDGYRKRATNMRRCPPRTGA